MDYGAGQRTEDRGTRRPETRLPTSLARNFPSIPFAVVPVRSGSSSIGVFASTTDRTCSTQFPRGYVAKNEGSSDMPLRHPGFPAKANLLISSCTFLLACPF